MNDLPPSTGALLELRLESIQFLARDTLLYAFASPAGARCRRASRVPISVCTCQWPGAPVLAARRRREPRRYQVGVKRDPKSRGGSSFMHEQLRPGVVIQVEPPRNNFPLNEEAEHSVLVGGGIGITPILCMARRLKALGRSMTLVYSCRDRVDVAFLEELRSYQNLHLHIDAEAGGVLDIIEVVKAQPANAHFYCCGPGPMLAAFEAATAHLRRRRSTSSTSPQSRKLRWTAATRSN